MTRLALLIGLMLIPGGAGAQGLPIDFDSDAYEAPAASPETAPSVPTHIVNAPLPRRSVRHGERTILIDRAEQHRPASLEYASRSGQ
jgi:hypothetical protein